MNSSTTCPRCGAESWHRIDIARAYCFRCRRFYDGCRRVWPTNEHSGDGPDHPSAETID